MLIRTIAIFASLMMFGAVPVQAQELDKAERSCASAKLKATGKKANAKLKCEAKAILQQLPAAETECLDKAETKFLTSFTNAEEKGGCVSDADATAAEASVDAFVGTEVQRQKFGTSGLPTCTGFATACGTCVGGGTCISHVPDGQLVCVTEAGSVPTSCLSDADCTSPLACIGIPGSMTFCAAGCP